MEKIPEQIRFNMIRASEKGISSWFLDELVVALEELEIRESHVPLLKNVVGNHEKQPRPKREEHHHGGTATALYVGRNGSTGKCFYCLQEHAAENCEQVKDSEERKSILRRYAKYFVCLNSGHKSFSCRNKSRLRCRICKGDRHVSICKDKPNAPLANKEIPVNPSAPPPLNANATSWVGSTGSGGMLLCK